MYNLLFYMWHHQKNLWVDLQNKLELWVTSLSDTPRLQYYDVQTLEYRYISNLIISPSKF
jgi:plasmid maintenance system antidote protein VapI